MTLIIFQRSLSKNFIIELLVININVLQQTACLVVNPIKVGNFASLFKCTLACRTLDSMTVSTYMTGLRPNAVSVVESTRNLLLDFFCSDIQLYVLLSPYLCFFFLLFISQFFYMS